MLDERWLTATGDVLDAAATVLDQLGATARAEITRILARDVPGYTGYDDLTHRVHATLNHIDYTN